MKLAFARLSLASLALAGFIALVPFENRFTGLRTVLLWVAAIAALYELRPQDDGVVHLPNPKVIGRYAGRVILLGALVSVVLLAIAIPVLLLFSPVESPAQYIRDLCRRILPFSMTIPFFIMHAISVFDNQLALMQDDRASMRVAKLEKSLWILFGAWVFWQVIASCYALDPKESFRGFFKEAGVYALACLLVVAAMRRNDQSAAIWIRVMALVGAAFALFAVAIFIFGYLAPTTWTERLFEWEWIRGDASRAGNWIIRVQYPFDSHNRLASFLVATLVLVPFAWAFAERPSERALWGVCGVIMLMGTVVSGTRGAMIAAAAGLICVIMARWKYALILIVTAAALCLILPLGIRQHLMTIFHSDTYRAPMGPVQMRVHAWQAAGKMIAERPVFGMGYGWKNFEKNYPKYNPEPLDTEEKPHAHNILLEVTVETGIIGALLFMGHQLALIYAAFLLIRLAARGSRERFVGWSVLGLLVGLHIFGLTNYSLRRNVGIEVWMVLGVAHVLVLNALSRAWDRGGTSFEFNSEERQADLK